MSIEDCSSPHCHVITANSDGDDASPSSTAKQTLMLLQSEDPNLAVEAAKDIRRLTKTSQRYRRLFSGAIGTLVDMLRGGSAKANEAALAALLNLAVKDEANKINIIGAGALKPIVGFLESDNVTLQEHSAAALITLSASSLNKPIIGASGAIPPLVNILKSGDCQAKVDAAMALYNLSTHHDNVTLILQAQPIPPLITLLKSCQKSSRTAEKCCALIESLVAFDEGRSGLTGEDGGILAVVEVVEGGALQSREHAVGALLTMCQSDRSKYREVILGEGVIPGLLELTVQGSARCRSKAQTLLRLLRDPRYSRSEVRPDTLENIVCSIISRMDGEEEEQQTGKGRAKEMLFEMVQVSMEQSLRRLQQRAVVCTPTDLPINY